jgi:serine/threonine protein kinase
MNMTRLLPGDPRFIGPYAVWARLGPGAIGPLYLGVSQGGTRVTVRVLREQFAADDELRARLAREVALAAEVRGPFLARLVDARLSAPGQAAPGLPGPGQAGPRAEARLPRIAWEYLPGPSLATVMSTRAAMPMSQVAALAAGLGAALRALHDAGVVHGDLHPGNVFVVNGMPRLTGFGTRVAMEAALTGLRPSPAAREFMAPEQATGGPASMAGDMFSLAAVLVRAAGGTGPFAIGGGEASWVNLGGVPPELRPLLTRCLDRDPGVRPTAAEFRSVVAAAHPALLSSDVVSGEVPGPITWPQEDPDAVPEPRLPAGSAVRAAFAAHAVPVARVISVPTTAVPPSGSRPGKRHVWRVAGSFAGMMSLVAILVVGAVISGTSATHTTHATPATPGSVGPVPGAMPLYLFDYQPGDCLYGNVSLDPSVPWPDPAWQVPCTQRHSFEVFYANDSFWPASEAYPGVSKLASQASAKCDAAFTAYDRASPTISIYTYTFVEPVTSDNWVSGARGLTCLAYEDVTAHPDSQVITTGSIKGAET